MSHKPISKDNREYWNRKLNSKFNEKKSAIESAFLSDIQNNADKNYPKFLKILGVQKSLEKLKVAETEYNSFKGNYDNMLNERAEVVLKHYSELASIFEKFNKVRDWNNDIPDSARKEDNGYYRLSAEVEKTLKDNCYEEVKKDFYNSKQADPLKKLDDWKEKAEDLLHSDMIGSEVLQNIQNICNQSKIKIFIPSSNVKEIAHSGVKENN